MNTTILNNWISLSVFFEKSHWPKIITEFLKRYITKYKANGDIGAFSVSFSSEQGGHIRLAFECTSDDQEQLADDFHDQLNSYLLLNPSPKPQQNYIGKAFFMDYYNNSIEYNLYQLDTVHNEINEIKSLVSERFLNVFGEVEYDESSMLTFAIYIIMTFCNTWGDFYKEDIGLKIKGILGADGQNVDGLNVLFKPYYNLFNENKEMIMAIYQEVAESQNDNDTGMNLWPLKVCYGNILSALNDHPHLNNNAYLPLDKVVADCTGMKHDSLPAIYYIIYLCIKEAGNKLPH
jgi:hypothetical protein